MNTLKKSGRQLVLISLLICASGVLKAQQTKPNILFFLVDDMGWKDLTYNGSTFYETPNIDALAKDGMIFSRAYAACPVCSPTRAAILTGRYPVHTGVTDILGSAGGVNWKRNTQLLPAEHADRLALNEFTIAEALKQGGYKTLFTGKWHLGPEGYWPEDQGFDMNRGGTSKGSPGKNGYFSPNYHNDRLPDGPAGEYLPERLTDETVSYIKNQKNSQQPFFIYHAFYLVHVPLQAKEAMIAKYQRKKDSLKITDQYGELGKDIYDLKNARKVRLNQSLPVYAAMVESLDQAVGKMVQALKDEGLYDETLIVFTSDNGGLSTAEGWTTSNLPLKGGKGWAYEGGIREPLIVRWPGVTKAGSVSNIAVSSIDYYPTLLQAAGLPLPSAPHVDGISIVPLLKGGNQKRDRTLFWHYPHYGNQGGAPFSTVMDGDFKLIKFYENGGYYELYNLKQDIGERNNLISKYPEKVSEMKTRLDAFLTQAAAKYPVPNQKYKAN